MKLKISTVRKRALQRVAPDKNKYVELDKKVNDFKDKSKNILVRCSLRDAKSVCIHLYNTFGKGRYGKNAFYIQLEVQKMKRIARITITKIYTVMEEQKTDANTP